MQDLRDFKRIVFRSVNGNLIDSNGTIQPGECEPEFQFFSGVLIEPHPGEVENELEQFHLGIGGILNGSVISGLICDIEGITNRNPSS